jgi:ATP-dependent Lhr-like helicase
VAAERLAEWLVVHPEARCHPEIEPVLEAVPGGDPPRTPEDALVTLLRDRLAGLGPVDRDRLAAALAVEAERLDDALTRLQGRGFAVRMEQGGLEDLWCERRLLARIHRYSRARRRQAVQAVGPAAFARFLARWHALDDPASLDRALERLEGWTAPVAAWERDLLAIRVAEAGPDVLDQRFLSGLLAWFRPLAPRVTGQAVVRASPVALVPRDRLGDWRALTAPATAELRLAEDDATARRIHAALKRRGAMFMSDLEKETALEYDALEAGLRSLVHAGAVTADAFSPLSWLLRPEREKRRARQRLARGRGLPPIGRWSLLAPADEEPAGEAARQERLATACRALLRRYGVVFRAVLEREPLLPPWRELLRCLRRMEDRGEVLGGRFVDGFSGEQFALPEAADLLRKCRRPAGRPTLAVISAADPLNLGGIVLPGPKTAAQAGHRILLEDGLPVARLAGQGLEVLAGASPTAAVRAEQLLGGVTPLIRTARSEKRRH